MSAAVVEAHAADDKKARETIEAKNTAESVVYQTEKALKDYGDKVSESERSSIENALNDLKSVLQNPNATAEELKSKTDAVQQASMQLGQKIYEQAQQQGAQNQNAQPGSEAQSSAGHKNDDGSVDADFEEVK